MTRVRKNYIIFKTENDEGPAFAGSFSSKKRAKLAISEDAKRIALRDRQKDSFAPNIEYRPDGGRLRMQNRRIDYSIVDSIQDSMIKE